MAPETTTFPYVPGQTSWTASYGSMTFTLKVLTPAPVAGQPVELEFTASDPAGCCGFYIWYGDGQGDGDGRGCPVPTAGPTATVRYSHTWSSSGRWKVLAGASGQSMVCREPQPHRGVNIIAWIELG